MSEDAADARSLEEWVESVDEWVEFVWGDLLTGVDENEDIRWLPSCGCIVRNDGEYLDLFVYDGGWAGDRCVDPDHELIWQMYYVVKKAEDIDAPPSDEDRAELVRLVKKYTNGWTDRAELLKKIGAADE
jgi:hypothetical protein